MLTVEVLVPGVLEGDEEKVGDRVTEYFCSWSGGVDSTATGILAVLHHEPLTAMIYSKVMFDDDTPADLPEHHEFIRRVATPWFERHGVDVMVVRSDKNFVDDFFYHRKGPRSKQCGRYSGYPMVGRRVCEIKTPLKVDPIRRFLRQHPQAVQYIGYAADEKDRLKQLKSGEISLLQKYGVTHDGARELCEKYGLLSPYYRYSKRGGCFFCPNAGDEQLRYIRDHHPSLWVRLLELQREPNIVRPGKFRIDEGLAEIEERFAFDDAQMTWEDLIDG